MQTLQAPMTVADILQALLDYHQKRKVTYSALLAQSLDERARILLRELVDLEDNSARVVAGELDRNTSAVSAYLAYGPRVSPRVWQAWVCRCGSTPDFEETLSCALHSDTALEGLLNRLESMTTSGSELASRIRDMETVKRRQVSKFVRLD